MKVIGLKRVTGTFNDKPYDNYNIYCLPDYNDGVVFGYTPNCIKVKATVLHECVMPENIKSLENQNIDFYYDAYRNVTKVFVK